MAEEKQGKAQELRIEADKQLAQGVYVNLASISHTGEEFVLDFVYVQPQAAAEGGKQGTLRSRVITSPSHMKRIYQAMGENISRYEKRYGEIKQPEKTSEDQTSQTVQ